MGKRTLKEKIRRLEEELEIEKKRNEKLTNELGRFRLRCINGAEKLFDRRQYGLLSICRTTDIKII